MKVPEELFGYMLNYTTGGDLVGCRKRKCPICFEQLRRDLAKDSNEPFSQFFPLSKLDLNLKSL